MLPDIPLTGERTAPGRDTENYWFVRHLACYEWAAAHLNADLNAHLNAREDPGPILDAGAGEGYGARLLAEACGRAVCAVELDAPTTCHIRARYRELLTVRANLIGLPFTDASFAAVVSLQVVEHIWDPVQYLRELARCTNGSVILSTPNRPVHSPDLMPGGRPENPFHVREFDSEELTELLHTAAPERLVRLFGLHHGPRIREWEERHGSLPQELIDSTNDDVTATHVLDFASTLDASDFRIEAKTAGAHDLVALW